MKPKNAHRHHRENGTAFVWQFSLLLGRSQIQVAPQHPSICPVPTHTATIPSPFFTAQQLLRISVTSDRKVAVAKRGLSMSWFSISRPFSLVLTEHMAFFHMRTTEPTVGRKKKVTLTVSILELICEVCVRIYAEHR